MSPASITAAVTYAILFASLYFEVFMLISLLAERPLRRTAAPTQKLTDKLPSVSVIVPCFNEETTVGKTIESLLSLNYPYELLQVIVVDDGSTDNTHKIALSYATDTRVSVFKKENGGKHSALNLALEHTSAELVGCLDADSYVAEDALLHVVSFFADKRVAAVTPGIHTQEPKTLLQHLQKAEYRLAIFTRAAFADMGATFITPGPFSIFRTSVVREVGGWRHAHSTEDLELGLRLQESGHIIRNEPFAGVFTKTPATLSALIRQRVRWSYGFLRNALDYRHMIGNARYGNLGLLALPFGILSVLSVLYFAGIILYSGIATVGRAVNYMLATHSFALPQLDLFYINTTVLGVVVYLSILLVLLLIFIGSHISGTTRDRITLGTPLFILLYGFLTMIWFPVALARAALNTGVRWR